MTADIFCHIELLLINLIIFMMKKFLFEMTVSMNAQSKFDRGDNLTFHLWIGRTSGQDPKNCFFSEYNCWFVSNYNIFNHSFWLPTPDCVKCSLIHSQNWSLCLFDRDDVYNFNISVFDEPAIKVGVRNNWILCVMNRIERKSVKCCLLKV